MHFSTAKITWRFDHVKTKKEGVSRTYKGYDGYAPISFKKAMLSTRSYEKVVHMFKMEQPRF